MRRGQSGGRARLGTWSRRQNEGMGAKMGRGQAGAGPVRGQGKSRRGHGRTRWAGPVQGRGGASSGAGPGRDLRCPGSWSAPAGEVLLQTRKPQPGPPGPRVRRTGRPRLGGYCQTSLQALCSGPGGHGVPGGLCCALTRGCVPEDSQGEGEWKLRGGLCVPVFVCAYVHVCVYVCVDVCAHQGNCVCAWSWVSACSRELSMCAKFRACARAVPCGRRIVRVCLTETVHVKFGEDCVCVCVYILEEMGGQVQ